jgi:hypothetical protein
VVPQSSVDAEKEIPTLCVKMSETTPCTNLVYEGIEETVWLPVNPP